MNDDLPFQGAVVTGQGVSYRIWAPQVSAMVVEILLPGGEVLRQVPMSAEGSGYFHGIDPEGQAGDRYKYRLNGDQRFPDPASRWQPEGVHGASMVIDPLTYAWTDQKWQRPVFRDLVIYELHVGAFSPEGTFRAAIEKLKHVRDLGANAIELLPIGDFAGQRNWGYDGVYLFAPSRAYGHPDDLRALVDAAHGLGLAVILDVVYNHFGPDGNYLAAYIGSYLDDAAKTPWGDVIRYGDPAFRPFRELVVSNPRYWMKEFHFDGFRLDATHAIMDGSPKHILQELSEGIHERGGYAIAEDSRNDASLILPAENGGFGFDAVWADDFHHIVRVSNTHEDEGYLGDFRGSLEETVDVLRHGWYYRGQSAKSEGGPRGTECMDAPPQAFIHCVSNHDQVGNHAFGKRLAHHIDPAALRASEALLCLTPYTPMIFMGQEWAASTPFQFFTDHHEELGKLIIVGRREEFKHFAAFQDPALIEKLPNPQDAETFEASKLKWAERDQGEHRGVLELCKTCLALRAAEPVFRPETRETWGVNSFGAGLGVIQFHSAAAHWLVIFDLLGGHEGSIHELTVPQLGNWSVVLSSNEVRFGGRGDSAFDSEALLVRFSVPETLVLRAG